MRRACVSPSHMPVLNDKAILTGSTMAKLSAAFAWSSSELCTPQVLAEGVTAHVLWWDEGGNSALILRFAAGGTISYDNPLASCQMQAYVYAGTIVDHLRAYPDGTFIHTPANQPRSWWSADGAELFAIAHRGTATRTPGATRPAR
jgi:hypothetical protein